MARGKGRHDQGEGLLARLRRDPFAVQTVRSTAAATLSYVVALQLSSEPVPLTAPLTALLVVQVTLYSTVTTSLRRVNSVVVGVLIAIAFSAVVGLSWWSLALVILASLLVGRLVRVEEFIPEVAISAMLVLGVTQVSDTAWDRVLETLIGAVVGMLFNLVLAAPVWVDTAGDSIEDLARRMRMLLLDVADEFTGAPRVEQAATRLHEARRLDNDVADVDGALRTAEDSLRLNPRVKEGLLHRVVLRTGLDTLEICAVVLRVLARTLTDLAKHRDGHQLLPEPAALAIRETAQYTADALVSFAVLVTAPGSEGAEAAETRLAGELSAARACRDHAADRLLALALADPGRWQLYGALLTEVDRILDELDPEHRGNRLMEELDRRVRERTDRRRRLALRDRWNTRRATRTDG
ncbi:FUSC family protein [Streptomyces tanashiensis]|uniref:FUSC family protein n=1 Tax=Streptomyces tanashiensis TaxID=67367 RepID=UPI001673B6B7|nr:aromatic acid exporter family protein [Streptomyces tanashiensis]GGT25629.1 FUSC family protein [Streptomyces tanashiensis]